MSPRSHLLHALALGFALAATVWDGAPTAFWAAAVAAVAGAYIDTALVARRRKFDEPAPIAVDEAPAAAPEPEPEPEPATVDLAPALRDLADKLSSGDLTARLSALDGADEAATSALNAALASLNAAVDESLALADIAAEGDLTARVTGAYEGHCRVLAEALNGLLDGLSQLAGALRQAVDDNDTRSARMAEVAASLNARSREQVTAFEALEADFADIRGGLDRVSAGAAESGEAIEATVNAAAIGRARIAEAVEAISRVEQSSKEIDGVADLISGVSQQSQLLSVNASVEAARAGAAGAGFGIVASEMGTLGARTEEAAQRIAQISKGAAADVAEGARLVAEAVDAIERIDAASTSAATASKQILESTDEELERLAQCRGRMTKKHEDVTANLELAASANMLADELAENAEALRKISSRFLLDDAQIIDAVRRCAAQASAELEQAVDQGEISLEDLFSRTYQEIEGTNPKQFMTPYVPITDRRLSPIVETVFGLNPGVAFGAIMNDDGFLPTHSRKFSKPQGSDPVWNTSNCRNRRFFNDRVGLACGKSTAPHLLQVYRRDMGGGVFVTMKDASAPIIVKGRHWGGFRIGYRSAQDEATAGAPGRGATATPRR